MAVRKTSFKLNEADTSIITHGELSDSAFPFSGSGPGQMLTPLKQGDLAKLLPSVRPVARRLSKAITFTRQAVEWGMGLLLPLPSNKKERSTGLDNAFRLYNYRVRTGVMKFCLPFSTPEQPTSTFTKCWKIEEAERVAREVKWQSEKEEDRRLFQENIRLERAKARERHTKTMVAKMQKP
ncbi:hypothetical protein ON010_g17372 [Phytophthora cinnamomi]|nr:hypothetical protein ON010_g17372 [Phytophthora cinnamomi]